MAEISGKFSDLSPLSGADGMTLVDGTLHVAFTSVVIAVTPTLADWSAATSVAIDVPSGQTDMVATPSGLYLLSPSCSPSAATRTRSSWSATSTREAMARG